MSKATKMKTRDVEEIKAFIQHLFFQQEQEEWLNTDDLKKLLQVSGHTVYRMRKRNEIRFIKVGGSYIYPKSYFNALLHQKYNPEE